MYVGRKIKEIYLSLYRQREGEIERERER